MIANLNEVEFKYSHRTNYHTKLHKVAVTKNTHSTH